MISIHATTEISFITVNTLNIKNNNDLRAQYKQMFKIFLTT